MGNQPPDWELYDAVEIRPVAQIAPYGGCFEVLDDRSAHDADFWTVYGRLRGGGVEALTDVSTRRLAKAVAALFERELVARGCLLSPRFGTPPAMCER
jgi:hypothetical protein